MKFTLSVRSFHTPATPFTCAWPPSFPSVPTSRATRVTSPANPFSWSTIVLIVSFSWRISPFTSTVIFFDRSPFATAVVTSAMFLTWDVRFPAIEFTLSVRSFHTPATPSTCACPPSFPSVPTSRATRVTSEANDPSCDTIVFTVRAICRNDPRTGLPSICVGIFCDRLPFATDPITRATSFVGRTRSPISEFAAFTVFSQEPEAPRRAARSESFPSLPTTRLTRWNSSAIFSFCRMIALSVRAISRPGPPRGTRQRVAKLPLRTDRRVERRSGALMGSPTTLAWLTGNSFGSTGRRTGGQCRSRGSIAGLAGRRPEVRFHGEMEARLDRLPTGVGRAMGRRQKGRRGSRVRREYNRGIGGVAGEAGKKFRWMDKTNRGTPCAVTRVPAPPDFERGPPGLTPSPSPQTIRSQRGRPVLPRSPSRPGRTRGPRHWPRTACSSRGTRHPSPSCRSR